MGWSSERKRFALFAFFTLALCVTAGSSRHEAQSQAKRDEADAIVQQLVKSLTQEQKAKAIIGWDLVPKNLNPGMPTIFVAEPAKAVPLRRFVRFTPGADREGIRLMELTAEQQTLVEKYIDTTMSEYGAKQARLTMDQEAHNRKSRKDYFVTIMGDPAHNYALRLWEHHLTISTGNIGSPTELLPNLLGGHGGWEPNISWVDEERIAVELWKTMTDDQKKLVAVAADRKSDQLPFPIGFKGMEIENLDKKQQAVTRRLLDERLRCYKPWMKAKVETIVKAHGGFNKLNLAFTGDPTATCAEKGNRFAWKITGDKFLCDFSSFPTAVANKETGAGIVGDEHIHMTLMGEAPGK